MYAKRAAPFIYPLPLSSLLLSLFIKRAWHHIATPQSCDLFHRSTAVIQCPFLLFIRQPQSLLLSFLLDQAFLAYDMTTSRVFDLQYR